MDKETEFNKETEFKLCHEIFHAKTQSMGLFEVMHILCTATNNPLIVVIC